MPAKSIWDLIRRLKLLEQVTRESQKPLFDFTQTSIAEILPCCQGYVPVSCVTISPWTKAHSFMVIQTS